MALQCAHQARLTGLDQISKTLRSAVVLANPQGLTDVKARIAPVYSKIGRRLLDPDRAACQIYELPSTGRWSQKPHTAF
jgi:hypothetical protein